MNCKVALLAAQARKEITAVPFAALSSQVLSVLEFPLSFFPFRPAIIITSVLHVGPTRLVALLLSSISTR